MKKILLSITALVIFFSATVLTSCSKDDTDAPVITLSGEKAVQILKGNTYVDAGATANDVTDGDLTASISSNYNTSSNPNVNVAGVYTITYTVTDADGNTATETRTVTVLDMAGTYTINGTFDGAPDTDYVSDIVTISTNTNNRILFNKFVNYKDAIVNANISGNSITIPQQDIVCGDPALATPVSRRFAGSGAITNATGTTFTISGTVALTSAPSVTIPWSYTFTK